jgi:hypothetical protein
MFRLLCVILSETCCGKNAAAAENMFQLVRVFQRSVTHSRVARTAHQAATIKANVCCVHDYNISILACIVSAEESICKVL